MLLQESEEMRLMRVELEAETKHMQIHRVTLKDVQCLYILANITKEDYEPLMTKKRKVGSRQRSDNSKVLTDHWLAKAEVAPTSHC